ncbi:MAG: hypothetical protein ABI863_07580 [Ginsengibacter sp.]
MQDTLIYEEILAYKCTIESFSWQGKIYNAAMSPVLYPEEDWLDFTGSFTGPLIDPDRGTIHFTLLQ